MDFIRRSSAKTEIGTGRFIGWLDVTASQAACVKSQDASLRVVTRDRMEEIPATAYSTRVLESVVSLGSISKIIGGRAAAAKSQAYDRKERQTRKESHACLEAGNTKPDRANKKAEVIALLRPRSLALRGRADYYFVHINIG